MGRLCARVRVASVQSRFILKDLPGTARVSVAEVNVYDDCPAWGFLDCVDSIGTDPRAIACGSTRSKETLHLTQITRYCQRLLSVSSFTHCEFLKGFRFMHGRQLQLLLLQAWPSMALAGTQLLPSWSQALVWRPTNSPSFCPSLSTPAWPQQ